MKLKEEILKDFNLKNKYLNSYIKHNYPSEEDLIEISMNEMRNEILKIVNNKFIVISVNKSFNNLEKIKKDLIDDIKNIEIK